MSLSFLETGDLGRFRSGSWRWTSGNSVPKMRTNCRAATGLGSTNNHSAGDVRGVGRLENTGDGEIGGCSSTRGSENSIARMQEGCE